MNLTDQDFVWHRIRVEADYSIAAPVRVSDGRKRAEAAVRAPEP